MVEHLKQTGVQRKTYSEGFMNHTGELHPTYVLSAAIGDWCRLCSPVGRSSLGPAWQGGASRDNLSISSNSRQGGERDDIYAERESVRYEGQNKTNTVGRSRNRCMVVGVSQGNVSKPQE